MDKISAFLKLIKLRLRSEMPEFWKNIAKAGGFILGLGLALIVVSDKIPEIAVEIAKYLVAVGTTITFVSQFTTKDQQISEVTAEDLKKKDGR